MPINQRVFVITIGGRVEGVYGEPERAVQVLFEGAPGALMQNGRPVTEHEVTKQLTSSTPWAMVNSERLGTVFIQERLVR
jgi:hypothetical protein